MGKIWVDNLKKKLFFSPDDIQNYEVVHEKNNNIKVVYTGMIPKGGILPNVFYNFGTIGSVLRISFATIEDTDILWEYRGEFILGEHGSIIFPSNVNWGHQGEPEFKPNHRYQFRITNLMGEILG